MVLSFGGVVCVRAGRRRRWGDPNTIGGSLIRTSNLISFSLGLVIANTGATAHWVDG